MNGPRFMRLRRHACSRRPSSARQAESQPASSAAAPPALDYGFFKAKVEPIFLNKRPGHTRCVMLPTINNAPLHLVPLTQGSADWKRRTVASELPAGTEGGGAGL